MAENYKDCLRRACSAHVSIPIFVKLIKTFVISVVLHNQYPGCQSLHNLVSEVCFKLVTGISILVGVEKIFPSTPLHPLPGLTPRPFVALVPKLLDQSTYPKQEVASMPNRVF